LEDSLVERITSPRGATVSYDKSGSGPSLVLVHGAFSDQHTNWQFVKPILRERFTVFAIARRGRGETLGTEGHSLEDEVRDLVALIEAVGEPVFLLGHSYGAHCSLAAALLVPDRIRKLVLYEAAWPRVVSNEALARLEELATAHEWENFAVTFFRDTLSVPVHDLDALRATELWPPIVADAKASLGDLRALNKYDFDIECYRQIECPVLLQIGSESPRDLYVTDALTLVLSQARIEQLPGQAHEGMTTAPEMYAESVTSFLLR
jgi:pimeloyl-ACP methyl ester carboxylesterase